MSDQITLADLIADHQQRTGDSYAALAKRSGLSKAKIGQLALRDRVPHAPKPETLDKLARGLGLPRRVVQAAALVTAGYTTAAPIDDQRIELLVSHLQNLDEDALTAVEALVDRLSRSRA